MPKVSIIIPVYNAEKFLHRCINSIIAQTYQNWECILVDDGSSDCSSEICDEYSQKDSRIRVIHKENGGVSSARNRGLDEAQGEWIMFVDSDDWIKDECLERCLGVIQKKKLDMLQFGFSRVTDGQIVPVLNSLESYVEERNAFIESGTFNVCVWGSIISRYVIEKDNIRFQEGIKLGEDQMFIMQAIAGCHRLIKISDNLYYYFNNPASAVNNSKAIDMSNSIKALDAFRIKYPQFKKKIDCQIANFLVSIVAQNSTSNNEIISLYKSIKLIDTSYVKDRSTIVFLKIAGFSPLLACIVTKLRFNKLFNKKTTSCDYRKYCN